VSRFTLTDAQRTRLVEIRRDLHRHPELAFAETRTAGRVVDELRSLGYEPRTGVGRTGVTTILEGSGSGPTVLLRADIDALPIREENEHPFVSTVPGSMHACGHDSHTATLLGVAAALRDAPPPRGRVKLVFQPAEEIGQGARAMIDDGVLDDPPVDAAFGLHVWPSLPVGDVVVTDGAFMGAVDRVQITIRGKGGHGAMPHDTRDPVVAAAHVILALQTIASRNVDPTKAVVVSVGHVEAGEAFNIIPDHAVLTGTLRSFDDDVWAALPDHLDRVVTHTAQALGCDARIDLARVNRPTVNDPAMAAIAREVATEMVGADHVHALRTLAGEDFGEFLARVPGAFMFVGAGDPGRGIVHPLHSPRFDLDESVFDVAVPLLCRVAHRFLSIHGQDEPGPGPGKENA
jgi:amidohydrolase